MDQLMSSSSFHLSQCYIGVLEEWPTNNYAIESQLMNRFLIDGRSSSFSKGGLFSCYIYVVPERQDLGSLKETLQLTPTEFVLGPGLLCSNFTYYAFEQCSKKSPIMLNIMPISISIMPQLNHIFYYFNEHINMHSTLYNYS